MNISAPTTAKLVAMRCMGNCNVKWTSARNEFEKAQLEWPAACTD